ncbi:MAG: hypothetical protein ACW99J_20705 [Candidatus Thorarchaeota archaeon]
MAIVLEEDGCNQDPIAGAHKLQWQEQGGTFADVGAASEISYYDGAATAVDQTASSFALTCTTHNNGDYSEDGTSSSQDMGIDESVEHWFCIDTSNAQYGVTYEFQLYDTTSSRANGLLGGTFTTDAAGNLTVNVNEGLSFATGLD